MLVEAYAKKIDRQSRIRYAIDMVYLKQIRPGTQGRLAGVIIMLLFIIPLLLFKPVFGNEFETLQIATTVRIEDSEVKVGDIVSLDEEGNYIRSPAAYDRRIVGVVVENPHVVYRTTDQGVEIVKEGSVNVNVTTLNGPIRKGDVITSSDLPGKGQKASVVRGSVVGVALQEFDESQGEKFDFEGEEFSRGVILVDLQITSLGKGLEGFGSYFDRILLSVLRDFEQGGGSTIILRYALAGLISLIAFFLSFNNLGKNISKGVEAIGRNPLAKKQIQFMIVVNIVLIALISLGAVILSLAIIRL